MAELFNQLFRGIWSDAIKRALGITKSPGGIERFGETLTPIIDLWSQPEWAFLRQEFLGTFFTNVGATAAEFSFIAIGLPSNSQQLMVVERVNARVAANVAIGPQARSVIAATGTLQGTITQNRDQRWAPGITVAKNPNVEVFTGSDPGALTGSLSENMVTTAATQPEFISPPYIVKPGGCLVVQALTVNLSLEVNWRFRVRTALPGELQALTPS